MGLQVIGLGNRRDKFSLWSRHDSGRVRLPSKAFPSSRRHVHANGQEERRRVHKKQEGKGEGRKKKKRIPSTAFPRPDAIRWVIYQSMNAEMHLRAAACAKTVCLFMLKKRDGSLRARAAIPLYRSPW